MKSRGSRRNVSWILTKKLDTSAGPGKIKRREVSWTLTKKIDNSADLGEIKSREVSWTQKVGLFFCLSCFPTAVLRTLSL